MRGEVGPIVVSGRHLFGVSHDGELLLALPSPPLIPHQLERDVSRGDEQPARQGGVRREGSRVSGQGDEYMLRYVLCQMCVTAGTTQGREIDQVNMAPDNFPKSTFGRPLDILAKKFGVGNHIYPQNSRVRQNRTEKARVPP